MTPDLILQNATVYREGRWQKGNLSLKDGRIADFHPHSTSDDATTRHQPDVAKTSPANGVPTLYNAEGLHLFPGFVDVHVHFREPGQEEKETIATGARAAAHGGYTTVCTMPNLTPVPDSLSHLTMQEEKIYRDASIHVLPYGAISVGQKGSELADFQSLAPHVCAFSDDGVGVQNADLMRQAMQTARSLNKCIVAHAEDRTLVRGGVIHDGVYARAHHHRGNPSESEWKQVERDLRLAEEVGAAYHVCHVSTKESIALIRAAQKHGVDVTCETAPHYLVLNDSMLREDGRFRMNPPIRGKEDQDALLEALCDGTILCVATDHAPHTAAEKNGGLDHSLNGIVGLETAFPILYTKLVLSGRLSLAALIDLLSIRPFTRFHLDRVRESRPGLSPTCGIAVGMPADLTLFDLNASYRIDPKDFLSKGKSSPFIGETVRGKCQLTLVGGEIAYEDAASRWRRGGKGAPEASTGKGDEE